MYYLPQPPFLVAILGVFIAITFGTAFQNLLEQKLRESYQNLKQEGSFRIERTKDSAIALTFWGVCFGVWIFLGGGLLVLGFGIIPSYGVSLLLTIFTAALVWDQINDVLLQLKEGGSKALELD
ncbi:MAG: hypothetical protein AAGF83_26620 [Cyanobacteria bacterium P01_G01_bin.67]